MGVQPNPVEIEYEQFLIGKRGRPQGIGREVAHDDLHPLLFPFQSDLTRWAIRKGRAALFADTGLGKTFMQLEWARHMADDTLIIAPLSVARQTIREAAKIGLTATYIREDADVVPGICITNYEMAHKLDPSPFGAVVLDESSILKAIDGKTRRRLTESFADTPYRLCCTATPAPNDIAEIANHAEFLGIMTRADMLASFFVHDEDGWRLKGHARGQFFRWMASWAMSVRLPSDIGYEDDGYILPPLQILPHFVKSDYTPEGSLFFTGLKGIQDRHRVRRNTVAGRVGAVAELCNNNDDQWIVWCGLNDESAAVAKEIRGAIEVKGGDDADFKAAAIEGFQDGTHRVLVTKPKIAGFGMNFQHCHRMAFVGLSDSWESYYQCIRRCHRFGQAHPVTAHIVLSALEREIYANVMRKEEQATAMSQELIESVQGYERDELAGVDEHEEYSTDDCRKGDYHLMLGDSVERLKEVEDNTLGLSVFSPPFLSLYTYSPTERDVGNCRTRDEFGQHVGYIADHLLRATMPGRNCCVHVAQVPAMLARDGYIGLKDFRGLTIELFESRGWIYHGEVCIDKDPQAQAIRTKSKALLFTQLRKDSSWLRPALADYILVFRKPGENVVPIHPDISNDEWIEWARPIWYGIRESDTLNVAEGREVDDERHICPLQLGTIARCIRLWSNAGDLVCSPFMGIGSEGYEAIRLGRRFVGIELKRSYYRAACRNIARAGTGPGTQVTLEFD
jgi:hypothetical protein